MGTQLSSIIDAEEISIEQLNNKKLAVDAFNMLYQFLTTIRQYDGTPLKDDNGNITSHLSGLFFRVTKLMKEGIKLAFVFDGVSPNLKKKEKERRKEVKLEAKKKYDLAVEEGDVELMKKYAGRTAYLNSEMIDEAKELIEALGLPIIQAPSEGEAQAAYMAKKGEFYGILSQDTDGLLFGSPRVIKNLSISGKKKKANTSAYFAQSPEVIELANVLNTLGIDHDQLIVVSILCGTDFNIGGIKGIGPKNAIKLVKEYGNDFEKLFMDNKWDEFFDYPWKDVFDTIKKIPISDDYKLQWGNVDAEKINEILIKRHNFSQERVEKSISDIVKKQAQKGLSDFF